MKLNINYLFYGSLVIGFSFSCNQDPKIERIKNSELGLDTLQVENTRASVSLDTVPMVEKKEIPKQISKPKAKPKPVAKKISVPKGAPSFKSTAARRYVRDYEAYVANYRKAVKSQGMDELLKLDKASASLTKQYRELMTQLSPDELDKLSQYMKKKSKQIDELSRQAN